MSLWQIPVVEPHPLGQAPPGFIPIGRVSSGREGGCLSQCCRDGGAAPMAPKGSEKGLAGEKRMRTPRAPESMVALTHLAVMLAYAAAAAVPTVTSRPLSLGPAWVPGADHVTGESTFLLYVKINKGASSTTAEFSSNPSSATALPSSSVSGESRSATPG